MLNLPFGTPYTLSDAYLFVQRSVVAFCFADILLASDDASVLLLARQSQTNACATLGWFPAGQFGKVDLVNIAPDGRVRQIVVKPHHTQLSHSWCIALRTPVFTEFLIAYIAAHKQTASDVSIGDVIQAAIEVGLHIEAVPVSGKSYLNIGTAEDLGRAVQPDTGSDD